MKLCGYVRVSKVGGRAGETFISPDVQRGSIATYAAANGHDVVEWFEDLDVSGGNASRPEFDKALEMIETGQVGGLIVAKLDRFMRSMVDALNVIERIEQAGGELISVADNFDSTTSMGRFARDIVLRLGQLERERISESWKVARSRAIERGVRTARCPFGYRRDWDKTKPKGERGTGRIEPDPKTRKIVVELFRRRASGAGWHELCGWLDERAPRPNGGAWPSTTVNRMLGLRTYIGEGEQGTRHKAIVPRALFEQAQSVAGTVPRYAPSARLLTGIVYCAGCGGLMTGTTDGKGYGAYRCRGRRSDGVCGEQARVSAKLADEYVERAFLGWLGQFDSFQVATGERAADGPTADDLATALELAESELAAYRDESLVSVIGRDAFAAGLRRRQAAVDEARDALRGAPASPAVDYHDLALRWPTLTVAEKREWIRLPISHVVVGSGHASGDESSGRSTIPLAKRVRIFWHGADVTFEESAAHDARG